MNDEDMDEGVDVAPTDAPDVGTDADEAGSEAQDLPRTRSPYWRTAFAVASAVVVLVVAVVGYQKTIPSVHVIRARLSRLVVTRPGVAAFNGTSPQAGEQNDAQTQLAAVSAAAKRSPNQTGVYSIEWSASQTSGAGMIAFLLPSDAAAMAALPQIRTQELAANSYASGSLARRSTYTVPGLPGSAESSGSVYTPSSKSAGSTATLVVTAFRYGRVVAVTEVLTTAGRQSDANTMAQAEYANLRHVEPGFSLSEVHRPVEATVLWAAGAVALAVIVAVGPVGWRRRARRRQRRLEEEMARRVVVRGQVIAKRRR